MKILFADALPEFYIDILRQRGDECVVEPDISAEDLPNALEGIDVLVVRSTKVTAEAIASSDQLSLIVRSGAGTNTIDCQAAADAGIYVCNVPGTNSVAVAELTLGLLLAIDRHIADCVVDLRNGQWNKKKYSEADGLLGKTLGIIGVGEIGLAVAERARSFGMSVIAVRNPNRRVDIESRIRSVGIRLVDDQETLLSESDVVSIHVPGGGSTEGLVDANFLNQMKDGSVLLNTSRGEVVDEKALLNALETKNMRAGLDVFCDEPKAGTSQFNSSLASHPRVVGSHHIGASTKQAQDATSNGTIEVIEGYRNGEVINCVNMATSRIGTASITVRHFDQVGVLAEVFRVLRNAKINVQTVKNNVFLGANSAVAVLDVSGELTPEICEELRGLEHVIQIQVAEHE
ncbi:MAG: hydroxyacid dehydrogenase [Acidimicrobiaceae bacterium]|jgi:D-3-phosphoglycerate dehydrogenase|nr:hydroxyacid dehydrogenase [Acidimicrobiaceae bacterium]|tara:strand:+ start:3879 stop:5087 length:1209 start_codon:yes stop_codon:yes gene_type:complete